MQHTARLVFSFSSPIPQVLEGALRPEAVAPDGAGETPKTRAESRVEGDSLIIDLYAEDISSLRATVNAHLRWVDAAAKAAALGAR